MRWEQIASEAAPRDGAGCGIWGSRLQSFTKMVQHLNSKPWTGATGELLSKACARGWPMVNDQSAQMAAIDYRQEQLNVSREIFKTVPDLQAVKVCVVHGGH